MAGDISGAILRGKNGSRVPIGGRISVLGLTLATYAWGERSGSVLGGSGEAGGRRRLAFIFFVAAMRG